jgi:hypothetical protein
MLKNLKASQVVSFGGIFIAIAVIFQSAPVFLPTIGMALSPLSTLPMILAAAIEIPIGIMVLFSSVLIMFIISPQEAVIMLLTTGPLGIAIGSLLFRKGILTALLLSTLTLLTGILIIIYVVGIPAFSDLSKSFSIALVLLYFIFSFGYVYLWIFCAGNIVRRLIKTKLVQSFF